MIRKKTHMIIIFLFLNIPVFFSACGHGFDTLFPEKPGVKILDIKAVSSESGEKGSFSLRLSTAPVTSVQIDFSSDNPEIGGPDKTSVVFTSSDWSTPQTINLSGEDDFVDNEDKTYRIIFNKITTDDPDYRKVKIPSSIKVKHKNNDKSGYLITSERETLITSETGTCDSFDIKLTSKPKADVVLSFESTSPDEGKVSQQIYTFTSENWNIDQPVNVQGVDDFIADGTQGYSIICFSAVSDDLKYSGNFPEAVQFENQDDTDHAGISLGNVSGNTTEAGAKAVFTVVLESEPSKIVVLNLETDNSEGLLLEKTLQFDATDWNIPKDVTVTGVDDNIDDDDIVYNIVFTFSGTSQEYLALFPVSKEITNIDDDTAGFDVRTDDAFCSEVQSGSQLNKAVFFMRLTSEPLSTVRINYFSEDSTEGIPESEFLLFNSINWNQYQTVSVKGVDDLYDDGDKPFNITFQPSESDDAKYNGSAPSDVITITNIDDDTAGVTIIPSEGLITSESGETDSFNVVLDSKPESVVTINMLIPETNPIPASLSIDSLIFTSENWNVPQSVTLTGKDDDPQEISTNSREYFVNFQVNSEDGIYDVLTVNPLSAINSDDDNPGITVSNVSGDTTEAGGTVDFIIGINTPPEEDVIISMSISDATEVVSDSTGTSSYDIVFPAGSGASRTVVLRGLDDSIDDGDKVCSVNFSSIESGDFNYSSLVPPDNIFVKNIDDDTAGVTVSKISGNTSEYGDEATFTVVLDSEPSASVNLNLQSDNEAEGVVDLSTLIFNNSNWNIPQTVTVTGVDDAQNDGNENFNVVFQTIGDLDTTDLNYRGLIPSAVEILNVGKFMENVPPEPVGEEGFSPGNISNNSIYIYKKYGGEPVPYVLFKDEDCSGKATVMKYENGDWQTLGLRGFSDNSIAENSNDGISIYVHNNDSGNADPSDDVPVPYVAFRDNAGNNGATVMKFSEGNWSIVGMPHFTTNQAHFVSICVLDDGSANGVPYIAYRDGNNIDFLTYSQAKVMKYQYGSWEQVGDDVSAHSAKFVNLKIYQNDLYNGGDPVLFCSYCDQGSNIMSSTQTYVKKYTGSSWALVGDSLDSGADYASLYIYESGSEPVPYIGYNDSGLKVKKFSAGSWISLGIDIAGPDSVSFVSLFVHNNGSESGIPYVGCRYSDGYAPVYLYNSESSWRLIGRSSVETEKPTIYIYDDDSLLGIPYLFYIDISGGSQDGQASLVKFNN